MIKVEDVKTIALSFPQTDQKPHFDRIAFTARKKIFATLSTEQKILNLKFDPETQFIFCPPDSNVIFPVGGGWGRQGWTTINLEKATKKLVTHALKEAYRIRMEK